MTVRLDTTAAAALKAPAPAADTMNEARLRQACRDFEALFLKEVLAAARRAGPGDTLLEPGPGREIYESLRDETLARDLAADGGLGFGDALYRQISRSMHKE